ncbi:hypothetical protein ACJX0J_023217, partial [Zea mays]
VHFDIFSSFHAPVDMLILNVFFYLLAASNSSLYFWEEKSSTASEDGLNEPAVTIRNLSDSASTSGATCLPLSGLQISLKPRKTVVTVIVEEEEEEEVLGGSQLLKTAMHFYTVDIAHIVQILIIGNKSHPRTTGHNILKVSKTINWNLHIEQHT